MSDKMNKLPKWAQEKFRVLELQRDAAITSLNEFIDNQTPSPFFYDNWICTGENVGPTEKKLYIQTHSMVVSAHGVELHIRINDRYQSIELQWSKDNRSISEISCIPYSFQSIRLKTAENCR